MGLHLPFENETEAIWLGQLLRQVIDDTQDPALVEAFLRRLRAQGVSV